MITKNQIKYLRSLHQKKYRKRYGEFIAEGEKTVLELLGSQFQLSTIYGREDWINEHRHLIDKRQVEAYSISTKDLERISAFNTPNQVLALCPLPEEALPGPIKTGFHLALDRIQDPGNLGTIIRTADWFGANSIILSPNCVDPFNNKTVQASMGSLFRVRLFFDELENLESQIPILASSLNGQSIYENPLPQDCILMIGNESQGLSTELEEIADTLVKIPSFGKAESLNAAVATSILAAEIRRPRS